MPIIAQLDVPALLGSLDPDEKIFQRTCKDAELSHDLFWAASSPSDRWFSAILTASQHGVLDRFLEKAVSDLPSVLRWRVRLIDTVQDYLPRQGEDEQRLCQKIAGLQENWQLYSKEWSALSKQQILETRSEEKLRLQSLIVEHSPNPNVILRVLDWDRNKLDEYRISLGQRGG